jgi:hypothetical protein
MFLARQLVKYPPYSAMRPRDLAEMALASFASVGATKADESNAPMGKKAHDE